MAIVSAFLVPGSPLPMLRPDVKPWARIADGMARAGAALAASRPDAILLYSTQRIAVLDQLWQTRRRVSGMHVDENWHEYGDLPFDLQIDARLARACIAASKTIGIRSKPVDYDGFPIDTGTITAAHFLNPGGRIPMVLTSNNVYHDWRLTERIARMAAAQARKQRKRVAVVGVGGLSGSFFRSEIDADDDRIAAPKEDRWNRKVLELMKAGDAAGLRAAAPDYAAEAKVDMGFKHLAFVLGALGGRFAGATVHAYGPIYGAGAAVVEFQRN